MKVALNASPISSGHKVRGIGNYTSNLIESLKSSKHVDLQLFENSAPEADIIHYPFFDLFTRSLPLNSKVKRVVTIHDVIPLIFPQHFPAGIRAYVNLFFQKKSLKNTQFVICDSLTSKKDIADKLSFPEEKIRVIYLAAGNRFKKIEDQKRLKLAAKKFNLPGKFILYVGDINWNKNIEGLTNAVKISGVNLVMVGASSVEKGLAEKNAIDKMLSDLNIAKLVTRTGFVAEEDVVSIYNLAQATLMPSYYEGFGLPVLESMACGTPVICSQVASLAEIGGDEAFYCDPTNPQDIASKIKKAMNLPAKEKEILSKKLIQHANKFSWEKVAKETICVYQEALK